jgi:hypothetical protein
MSAGLAIAAALALAAVAKVKAGQAGSRSSRPATWPEVQRSMLAASAKHAGGPRDARWALGHGEEDLLWTREQLPIHALKVEPISAADVRRYARRMGAGEAPPPVVVAERGRGLSVIDGAHRVAAAKSLGLAQVDAWVGRQPAAPARGSRSMVSFRMLREVPPGYSTASWPFVRGTVLEDAVTEIDEDEGEEPDEGDRLYHVTSAASKVLASRIKSRQQLRTQKAGFAGLGGGIDDHAADLVSVSVTLHRAIRTRNAMRTMVRAAKDQILASEAIIEAIRWNDFPSCLETLTLWDTTPDEGEDEGPSAYDEAVASFQLQILSPDDEVYAGPLDTQQQWINFVLNNKESIDKNDPYLAVQRFEKVFFDLVDLFPDTFDVCAPGIGFLMRKQDMAKIDENDIKILLLAAKGEPKDMVPSECELRFRSDQLVVVGVEA